MKRRQRQVFRKNASTNVLLKYFLTLTRWVIVIAILTAPAVSAAKVAPALTLPIIGIAVRTGGADLVTIATCETRSKLLPTGHRVQ